jgi:hypothetical protein
VVRPLPRARQELTRALAAAAVVCAAVTPAALASPVPTPTPAVATAAFGRLVHHRYGAGLQGYWTCPEAQKGDGGSDRLGCLGEVHAGRFWHQLSTDIGLNEGRIIFAHVFVRTWRRRWSPYSRRFNLRKGEARVPGVASVNSPAYDWGWLARRARRLEAGQSRKVDAYDGDDGGLLRFFTFSCSRRDGLIRCRNTFGDALRYRPDG